MKQNRQTTNDKEQRTANRVDGPARESRPVPSGDGSSCNYYDLG